jgi:cyclic pyranopterin monophosphate synthase
MTAPSGPTPGDPDDPGTGLTHLDGRGRARMVDVSAKARTRRLAMARCVVVTTTEATAALAERRTGLDVIETARVAGVQAAKQTAALIPLCHPILVDRVKVEIALRPGRVEIGATAEIVERTGVEMEALTACAISALSVVKAALDLDPGAHVEDLTLWRKTGGRSGDWERPG